MQGYDNLVVVTDHKPLVHLFSDRTLDQITNSRLFSLNQRTLPWRFTVHYMPGKGNCFSDAPSCYRASGDSDSSDISDSEVLAGIMLDPEGENDIDIAPISSHSEVRDLFKEETSKDKDMMHLTSLIQSEFPEDKKNMPLKLQQYSYVRNKLHVVDSVVVMIDELSPSHTNRVARLWDRIVLPPFRCPEILSSLHAAHQGTTGMNERAKASV